MIRPFVRGIVDGATRESGVRQILEIIWYTSADYLPCSNVTFVAEFSNTSVPSKHTWGVNIELLWVKTVRSKKTYKETFQLICILMLVLMVN